MVQVSAKTISISHINVRQSISFLIIKLLLIEFISGSLTLILFFSTSLTGYFSQLNNTIKPIQMISFTILVIIKMCLEFLTIFQWLNEYYEITTNKIYHRSGFFFKKEDHFTFDQISTIGLQQSFLGKLLNYGTIELYDRFDKKHKYLYLIHNPIRYFKIIEGLIPRVDEKQQRIREHLIEVEE